MSMSLKYEPGDEQLSALAPVEVTGYQAAMEASWVWKELTQVPPLPRPPPPAPTIYLPRRLPILGCSLALIGGAGGVCGRSSCRWVVGCRVQSGGWRV